MAQFTMPLNWEKDYFEKIDFTNVCEVYGKLREDFPGGGKSSMVQAEPSKKEVAKTVQEAHRKNLKFNYLINSTCISNLEFTKKGYKKIRELLDWLSEVEVDKLTLGLPFLVEMTKLHYPHFKINISTQAGVNCLEKVKYWEEIGADSITLSHVEMNRDFKEIQRIAQNSNCELQLIVNMICKRRCPYVTLHGNFNAHASQTFAKTNRYNMDYYFLSCLARNFSDPLSIIKSNWIRPEDIKLYESLGVTRFKIVERGLTTEALSFIINAYSRGSHDGNLMDLIPTMSKYIFMKKQHFPGSIKDLFRMSFVNPIKLKDVLTRWNKLKESIDYYNSLNVYIDNKQLDGVLEEFIKKDCLHRSCSDCDYCEKLAKEKLRITADSHQYASDCNALNEILKNLVAGAYF